MSDRPNRVEFVIQKYRLAELTFIEAEQDGKNLGRGKVMSDDTLQKFLEGDPSGNAKYLDWMLFQAGGGQDLMEKGLQLWNGATVADPNSLRNQCHADFIEEQVKGYTDDHGIRHAPVSGEEAEAAWVRYGEERNMFEFVMGDQDVALEDGYGFYRHWPGKDGHYLKIVNAIKLWHLAQPKLLAQNQRYQRYMALSARPADSYSIADAAFMCKCQETPMPPMVVLDIYAGWKPNEYSQKGATYKNLGDLLRCLADVRKTQILRDIRFEQIYEDHAVKVVCPLTIGASIKFGIGKWCVCNRSEFDRSFEGNHAVPVEGNWQRYGKTGPLVFMAWKVPMPAWLHKIAIHIDKDKLKRLSGRWDDVNWVDCQNQQAATNYQAILERLQDEHLGTAVTRLKRLPDFAPPGLSSDDRFYQWGGREPGPAWENAKTGQDILASFKEALVATRSWARTFQHERLVLDYVTDITAGV